MSYHVSQYYTRTLAALDAIQAKFAGIKLKYIPKERREFDGGSFDDKKRAKSNYKTSVIKIGYDTFNTYFFDNYNYFKNIAKKILFCYATYKFEYAKTHEDFLHDMFIWVNSDFNKHQDLQCATSEDNFRGRMYRKMHYFIRSEIAEFHKRFNTDFSLADYLNTRYSQADFFTFDFAVQVQMLKKIFNDKEKQFVDMRMENKTGDFMAKALGVEKISLENYSTDIKRKAESVYGKQKRGRHKESLQQKLQEFGDEYYYESYPTKAKTEDKIRFLIKKTGEIEINKFNSIFRINEGMDAKKQVAKRIKDAISNHLTHLCFIEDGYIKLSAQKS